MDADGGNIQRLTNKIGVRDHSPSWSPDGEKIAFSSFRDGKFNIYLMNPDGTNQIRLDSLSGHNIQPDWRPITNVNAGNNGSYLIQKLRAR